MFYPRTQIFHRPVPRVRIGDEAADLAVHIRPRGQLLDICAPRVERPAPHVGHTAMIEDEAHVRTFPRQLDGQRQLPRLDANIKCQLIFRERPKIFRKQ